MTTDQEERLWRDDGAVVVRVTPPSAAASRTFVIEYIDRLGRQVVASHSMGDIGDVDAARIDIVQRLQRRVCAIVWNLILITTPRGTPLERRVWRLEMDGGRTHVTTDDVVAGELDERGIP